MVLVDTGGCFCPVTHHIMTKLSSHDRTRADDGFVPWSLVGHKKKLSDASESTLKPHPDPLIRYLEDRQRSGHPRLKITTLRFCNHTEEEKTL